MLNLNELNKYKEDNRIEAKRAAGGLPKSLWETYSAFANTQGGYILLGAEEQEDKALNIVGAPDPERLVKEFWDTINNRQKVSVNILADRHVRIEEIEGKHIVAIDIPRADRRDKPVYINNNPIRGSYRRNWEGDYHCTEEEVRAMFADQATTTQDTRALERLGLDAFDYETVRRYRIIFFSARPKHVWESLGDAEFLFKLGCVDRAEDGTLHPTGAGILMFGYEHEIVKEFPNYFLDYQEHGDETTRWTDRIISSSGDWSGNVYDFYYRVYNRIAQEIKTPFKLVGDTRIDDTPVHKALREAIANCLIHANHYGRRGIVIHRRPGQITIANPGGMRISIDEAVLGGISDPRNQTLIKLFNLVEIGERSGSGLPGIFAVWKDMKWPEPALEEQFNPDRTVLSLVLRKTSDKAETSDKKRAMKTSDKAEGQKGEARKQAIIAFLTDHESCSAGDVADAVGISAGRMRVYLKELTNVGTILSEGANRNRTYRLKP
ncbi:MAG: putative DNA binding domain-containing protein [Deltaproteobacteria bacterium]|nr:putative DNA binding domain-containing protein [Deltaproteobacteria bacterium]